MDDILAKYKGNYIKEMRKLVGHAPLMVIGCGVIIENDKGQILLQKRRDNGCWAIIGGAMEMGEKTFPNGDICCGVGIVFKTREYRGEIKNNTEEAVEHRFFDKENLPDNLNAADKQCILNWAQNPQRVIVD